jgi:hypothetical protein
MRHTYNSRPTQVVAIRIPHTVPELEEAWLGAFGETPNTDVEVATRKTTADDSTPRRVESVTMTTAQGQLVTAKPGEWAVQEQDPTRFYPVADDVFVRRYVVRGRPPVDSGSLGMGGPVTSGVLPVTSVTASMPSVPTSVSAGELIVKPNTPINTPIGDRP